jgi:microsomal dipeptidase-like Zn-dependent dipeptidase
MGAKSETERTAELHDSAIVIDGHCDILIPVTEGKMTLGDRVEVPDLETWIAPPGLERHPLVGRGHSDETILKFLGGNYLRVFEQAWG